MRNFKFPYPPKVLVAIGLYVIACLTVVSPLPQNLVVGLFHAKRDVCQKHQRLRSVGSPKIVIVGGSNVKFGIDSEAIERAFAVPVVNMGSSAPLGLRFMLVDVKDAIQAGDIVVIIPEYEYFNQIPKVECNARLNGSADLIGQVYANTQNARSVASTYCSYYGGWFEAIDDSICFLRRKQNAANTLSLAYHRLVDANFRISLVDLFKAPTNKTLFSSKLNKWGDEVGHLDVLGPGLLSYAEQMFYEQYSYYDEASRVVSRFGEEMTKRGATVVLLPPPSPAHSVYMWKLNDIHQHWLAIKHVTVLGTPEKYTFPRELFFDTTYHLDKVGRTKRTRMLINDLSVFIADRQLIPSNPQRMVSKVVAEH